MRSLSPLSRRILKKAGIAAAFFCSAFLFGSVLSHFTCRALRKAAPVFLSAAPETPVSSVSMPVLSSAAENWGLSFPEKGKTPVGNATSEELAAYNAWFAASPEENIIYLTFDCGYENGNTEAILDALKKHNAPAAFFVVGHMVESAPDIVHQRFLMRSRSIRLPQRSLSSAIFSPTSRILSNVWQRKAISSETTPGRTRICPKSPRRKPSQKN